MSTELATRDEAALAVDDAAYGEQLLERARGFLAEYRSVEELREAAAQTKGIEAWMRESGAAEGAVHAAQAAFTLCKVEIAKLERAAAPGRGANQHVSAPDTSSSVPKGRRGQENKALAEATPEQVEAAIAEVREEGKSPTPGAVARKLSPKSSANATTAAKRVTAALTRMESAAQTLNSDLSIRRLRDVPEALAPDPRPGWREDIKRIRKALAEFESKVNSLGEHS